MFIFSWLIWDWVLESHPDMFEVFLASCLGLEAFKISRYAAWVLPQTTNDLQNSVWQNPVHKVDFQQVRIFFNVIQNKLETLFVVASIDCLKKFIKSPDKLILRSAFVF
jgi:hypothetical protein